MKKPGVLMGGFIGALLAAPLVAVFYLAWKLFGLPFAPFDVFDWLAQQLPGSIITYGIDTMVYVIRSLNLGGTAETAKLAEQAMAVGVFLVAGMVAGAILFLVLRFLQKSAVLLGILAGAIPGVPVLIISLYFNKTATTSPFLNSVWILGVFLAWGAALGWSYNQLRGKSETTDESEIDSAEPIDRRRFLIKLGGATAAITVVGAVVGNFLGNKNEAETGERWSAANRLPNADAPVQPAPGTRPEFTPLENHYRIDISTIPPSINGETWRLKIGGLVEKPLEVTLDQIRGYEQMHQFVTLSCISNPVAGDLIGTTRWTGVNLQKILPDWKLQPNATHLKISAADGFWEVVSLEQINQDGRIMLAYAFDGVPLPEKHGFPLRIYIPGVYGMKQPKWIQSIEAIDHWEEGYWLVRGWDKEAKMKATSVIDTVAVDQKSTNEKGETVVPIGGIAHAGARGISNVEVRLDDGDWQTAQLRPPISETTWTIWRVDIPIQAGEHTLTVRCTDGSGAAQIVEQAEPHPSGASGLHSKKATV